MIKKLVDIYVDAFSGLSNHIWILGTVMFINRAGSMILPFMSLYITESLGHSLTAAGWVLGAYGLGSIFGAFIGGIITDRHGFYHVQLYSFVISAIILTVLVFVTDYYSILTLVFLYALVADTIRPANSVAVAAYAKPENRTRSFSLMRFSFNLGFSIGPAVGGLIAAFFGFKWIFVLDAATCVFAAFLLYRYLPYNPTKGTTQIENIVQKENSAYKDGYYLLFVLFVALYAYAFFQLFTTVPVYYAKEWSFSPSTIGLLLALNGLIVVVFEMPIMKRMEHLTQYMKLIAIGTMFMFVSFLFLITSSKGLWLAILYCIFISASEIFAMPFMTNFAVSRPSERRRGQYMALYSIAYGVAHISAPTSSMWIAEHYSFKTLYVMMAIISFVLIIIFLLMNRNKQSQNTFSHKV